MRPVDLVGYLHDSPIECQMAIAQWLLDACLADVLEEFGDDDWAAIVSDLEASRTADALDVTQPDDMADLVSEFLEAQAQAPLSLIEPEEVKDVCRLLSHTELAAGSLITADPVIFGSDATVAQMLASVRHEDLLASPVTVAFITRPPEETPTGPYLGMVHIQRVLHEPPQTLLGAILGSDIKTTPPQVHTVTVTCLFATYNLTVFPVVDEDSHLLGAVFIDDPLDELLPKGRKDYGDEAADCIMARGIDG